MSGICGIIHWDKRPVNTAELELMAEPAAHRGPDGIHYRTCGQAGFAHLALHITPESVRERQPLAGPEGQALLVADARIDNRDDLIPILAEKELLAGPEATDPEIILAAYRLWGTECPAHLLGDFAFAMWDASQQHLFAARDPMAMRAFYYRWDPRRFLFGTEVKQILAAPEVPARIFEPAVAAHLAGCFHHLDWTFYEGIAQLLRRADNGASGRSRLRPKQQRTAPVQPPVAGVRRVLPSCGCCRFAPRTGIWTQHAETTSNTG
jgi:asparagine synthase (glutamine-hydrolysing)